MHSALVHFTCDRNSMAPEYLCTQNSYFDRSDFHEKYRSLFDKEMCLFLINFLYVNWNNLDKNIWVWVWGINYIHFLKVLISFLFRANRVILILFEHMNSIWLFFSFTQFLPCRLRWFCYETSAFTLISWRLILHINLCLTLLQQWMSLMVESNLVIFSLYFNQQKSRQCTAYLYISQCPYIQCNLNWSQASAR